MQQPVPGFVPGVDDLRCYSAVGGSVRPQLQSRDLRNVRNAWDTARGSEKSTFIPISLVRP